MDDKVKPLVTGAPVTSERFSLALGEGDLRTHFWRHFRGLAPP
jgi:hypothetical protein